MNKVRAPRFNNVLVRISTNLIVFSICLNSFASVVSVYSNGSALSRLLYVLFSYIYYLDVRFSLLDSVVIHYFFCRFSPSYTLDEAFQIFRITFLGRYFMGFDLRLRNLYFRSFEFFPWPKLGTWITSSARWTALFILIFLEYLDLLNRLFLLFSA